MFQQVNVENELERLNADSNETRKVAETALISICRTPEEHFLMNGQLRKLKNNFKERQWIERQPNELLKILVNAENRIILERELIELWEELNERRQKEHRLLVLCKNPDLDDGERLLEMAKLIQEGVEINCTDDDQRTPLLLLCERGRGAWLYKCIELILSNQKFQQPCQGIHNCGSYHRLSKNNMAENVLEIFQLLIARGINIDCNVYRGENALLCICKYYYGPNLLSLVRLLIDSKVFINSRDADGKNALMAVCGRYDSKTNNTSQVMKLLIEQNIDLNCTDEWGQNALFYLLEYYENADRYDLVKLFVHHGIDVNCRDRLHGLTALSLLCFGEFCYQDDFMNIVKLLIENGTDVNTIDDYGEHVFIKLCASYDKEDLFEIIHLFIQHGVDLTCRSNFGSNALVKLCENYTHKNLIDIVELLISNGIDVKCRNHHGRDVIAALFRSPKILENLHDVVRLLLRYGARFESCREADRQRILSSYVISFKRNNVFEIFLSRSYGLST